MEFSDPELMYIVWYTDQATEKMERALFTTKRMAESFATISGGTLNRWSWHVQVEK